ncbi:MAG: hypothetical protein HFK03_06560 [Clostridia bacterium]|jgi:hypothetical protein|nr:hypothetical protein [Clostridia bacterium]
MKAPYFRLEQSEEAEIISKIILSDKTPRRFVRHRAPRCSYVKSYLRRYAYLWVMSDSDTLNAFQNTNKISFCDVLRCG